VHWISRVDLDGILEREERRVASDWENTDFIFLQVTDKRLGNSSNSERHCYSQVTDTKDWGIARDTATAK